MGTFLLDFDVLEIHYSSILAKILGNPDRPDDAILLSRGCWAVDIHPSVSRPLVSVHVRAL